MTFLYASILSMVSVSSATIAYVIASKHHEAGIRAGAFIIGGGALWLMMSAVEIASDNLSTKYLFYRIHFVGVLVLAAAWLILAMLISGYQKFVRMHMLWLSIVPLITLLLIFTNESHKLIFSSIALNAVNAFLPLDITLGLGYWLLIVAYNYGLILIGLMILLRRMIASRRFYRLQAVPIVVISLVPFAIDVAYMWDRSLFPYFDPSALALTVAGIVLLWRLVYLPGIDVVPVAHEIVIDNMSNAIIVLDTQSRVVDLNPSAEDMIGHSLQRAIGKHVQELWTEWPKVEETLDSEKENEVVLGRGTSQKVFELRCSLMKGIVSNVPNRLIILHDITHLKAIEEKLHTNEQRFRNIAERSFDAIAAVDLDGRFTFVSPSIERISGYRPEELMGLRFWNFVADSDISQLAEVFKKGMRGESVEGLQLQVRKKDGSFAYVEVNGSPVLSNGQATGIQGVIRDITERRQAEEELRQSEERFRSLVENTSDWIWEVDASGSYTYSSPKVRDVLGYDPQDIIGKTPFDFMPPELAKRTEAEFASMARERKPISGLENINLHKSGRKVMLETSAVPILDSAGELLGYRGIDRDVTERKRIEAQLRDSERRFRGLVDSAAAGVGIIDLTGHLTYANRALANLMGYSVHEILNRSFVDFLQPEDTDKLLNLFLSAASSEEGPEIEFRAMCKDGQTRTLWTKPTALTVQGEITGFVAIIVDMTDRERAEQALRESEEKFRSLVEGAATPVAIADMQGRFTYVNRALAELVGYSTQELLGQPFFDYLHLNDKDSILTVFIRGVSSQNESSLLEFRVVHRDGTIRHVMSKPTRIAIDGKTLGFQAIMTDITERRKAEDDLERYSQHLEELVGERTEALAESERRYREMADLLPQIVFEIDSEGSFTFLNRAGFPATGYTEDDLAKGLNVFQMLVQEDRERALENTRRILSGEKLGVNEYTAVRKDGSTFPTLIHSSVITREGKPAGLRGTILDITERKQMEEQLRATKERLQFLIATSPAVTYTGKLRYPFGNTYMSENVREVLGYEPRDFLEDETFWFSRIHPDDRARVLEEEERLVEKGRIVLEYRFQHRDGTYRWMHDEDRLVRDSMGNPLESVGYWVDITAQRDAEEAIRRDLEQLAALDATVLEITQSYDLPELLDTILERAVHLTHAEGGGLYLSNAEREELRLVMSHNIPRNYTGIVLRYGEGAAGRVATTGKPLIIDDYRRWEGRASVYEKDSPFGAVLVAPLVWQDQVIGVIDVFDAASGRRFTEEDLKLLARFAGHATIAVENARLVEGLLKSERMAAIGETAAMVGHDLRNPLQGIEVATYYLKKRLNHKTDPRSSKMLRLIEDSIAYSDKIVNDLLEYSKEIILSPSKVTIKSVLSDSLRAIEIPGNITINDATPNEPEMMVDALRLRRVFTNIIMNAIDAMPKGGQLTIGSQQSDGNVEVSFSDTGIGMSSDILERLWKPLQTTKARGMGLGLAISKQIVDAHKGSINIESKAGKGTTVTITLPLS